jgi:hypothetical protein
MRGCVRFALDRLTNTSPGLQGKNKAEIRRSIALRYIDWNVLRMKRVSTSGMVPSPRHILVSLLLLMIRRNLVEISPLSCRALDSDYDWTDMVHHLLDNRNCGLPGFHRIHSFLSETT